jgi:pyrrolidone-carboxylate peptidase
MPESLTAPARETPRLLLAGFGPYAQAPDNPAGRVVEQLAAEGWTPPDAIVRGQVIPVSWASAPKAAIEAARAIDAHAVLLLATSTQASDFRIEMRAQNRAAKRRADALGERWKEDRILPTGPGVVRTTAPVAEMVQAVKAAGFAVHASSESGDYLGNFVLYRLLAEFGAEGQARPVGCFTIPVRTEIDTAVRAAKAAVQAFASSLSVRRSELLSA